MYGGLGMCKTRKACRILVVESLGKILLAELRTRLEKGNKADFREVRYACGRLWN
jgi:hypothetical protein